MKHCAHPKFVPQRYVPTHINSRKRKLGGTVPVSEPAPHGPAEA